MPRSRWKVLSFNLDGRMKSEEIYPFADQVEYSLSFPNPILPPQIYGELLWLQHSFGIWGRNKPYFLDLIHKAKSRRCKIIVSFHTIHFQSNETIWGFKDQEFRLLKESLPLIDAATVFTNGAYRAVSRAFPQYINKVTVLRHGVHIYPSICMMEARRTLLNYLNRIYNSPNQKKEISHLEKYLFSRQNILLGNFGFITSDKDPTKLYELGRLLQKRLPNHKVITIFIGKIQKREDRKREDFLPILQELRMLHNGKESLFFEDYLPEEILPLAFKALDFTIFWCHNATQSGRMAHAQGTGTFVVGRKIEGLGETLELSGLPTAYSLREMADKLKELVLNPKLKEENIKLSFQYARHYSFTEQAKKHFKVAEAVITGKNLPILDRTITDGIHLREISNREYRRFV